MILSLCDYSHNKHYFLDAAIEDRGLEIRIRRVDFRPWLALSRLLNFQFAILNPSILQSLVLDLQSSILDLQYLV